MRCSLGTGEVVRVSGELRILLALDALLLTANQGYIYRALPEWALLLKS
jgi:hypothetical protein